MTGPTAASAVCSTADRDPLGPRAGFQRRHAIADPVPMGTPTTRRLSPSSLNRFLGCEHRTYLDLLDERGLLAGERLDPRNTLLAERGERHEQAFLEQLRAAGRDVVVLDRDRDPAVPAALTEEAMRAGREVVYQACFLDAGWVGYEDFLMRLDEPSDLGGWSY